MFHLTAEMTLSLVCEAILCFVFYGTALHFDGNQLYETKLLEYLNLRTANFKTGRPFRGIAGLRNVRIVGDRIRLDDENIPGVQPLFVGYGLCKQEAWEMDGMLRDISYAVVDEDIGGFGIPGSKLDSLMKFFVKRFIVHRALEDTNCGEFQEGMKKRFKWLAASKNRAKHCTIFSSTDLLNFMTTTRIHPWNLLIKVMETNLRPEHYQKFLENIPTYIDNLLYVERMFLILDGERDITIVVLPFNQTEQDCLWNISREDGKHWEDLFKQVVKLRGFKNRRLWRFTLFQMTVAEQAAHPLEQISGTRFITETMLQGLFGPRMDAFEIY